MEIESLLPFHSELKIYHLLSQSLLKIELNYLFPLEHGDNMQIQLSQRLLLMKCPYNNQYLWY